MVVTDGSSTGSEVVGTAWVQAAVSTTKTRQARLTKDLSARPSSGLTVSSACTLALVLRIANCSGFYGDRLSAAKEMVEGGPVDVLTGDYLAELTMAILWRARHKDPSAGYASTFLIQMEQVLSSCLERGIKIVSNAGGLNPRGLAERVAQLALRLGISPRIAIVEGDDLLPRLDDLMAAGEEFRHLETGEHLRDSNVSPVTANAYLGCWPIAEALRLGADIVITGRVTDAAVAMGPAIWYHGWAQDDWDRLASSLVAGHIIECGAQATGGNFSFFKEVPHLQHVGFPIVEMEQDGSFVVTKHEGTGGLVSTETVTAQLLYEIDGPRYLSPDVVALFDTIKLTQVGIDRVAVTGVRGEPPGSQLKVAINYWGGYRNSLTFGLCGLDVAEKAAALTEALWNRVGDPATFQGTDVRLVRSDRPNPTNQDEALAWLRVSVKDQDPEKVGRAFSRGGVELVLANYPGFFLTAPPDDATPYSVYWPALIDATKVVARVTIDGSTKEIGAIAHEPAPVDVPQVEVEAAASFEVVMAPLGLVAGARSGDKGGNANVGVWARRPEAYRWLYQYLTAAQVEELLPETEGVRRFEFPNLLALNFVLPGYLGQGVAASTRTDPQAKSLGEYLRAKVVPIPRDLLAEQV